MHVEAVDSIDPKMLDSEDLVFCVELHCFWLCANFCPLHVKLFLDRLELTRDEFDESLDYVELLIELLIRTQLFQSILAGFTDDGVFWL